jgi:hypothetical protein
MRLPGPPRTTRAPPADSQACPVTQRRGPRLEREQVELALQEVEDLLGLDVPVRTDVEARCHLGLEGRPPT